MKDYRTTAEVEASRCYHPRQPYKPCPCGRVGDKECSHEPNLRVARIVNALSRGQVPVLKRY